MIINYYNYYSSINKLKTLITSIKYININNFNIIGSKIYSSAKNTVGDIIFGIFITSRLFEDSGVVNWVL